MLSRSRSKSALRLHRAQGNFNGSFARHLHQRHQSFSTFKGGCEKMICNALFFGTFYKRCVHGVVKGQYLNPERDVKNNSVISTFSHQQKRQMYETFSHVLFPSMFRTRSRGHPDRDSVYLTHTCLRQCYFEKLNTKFFDFI
jgi:hypothetical protein